MVVCLDNGYIDGNLNEEKEAYNVLVEMSDSEDEDEDEGHNQNSHTDDDQEGDKTDADDENDESSVSTSRKGVKSINEDKIQTYYSQSSTIASSCSITVYALVSAIGETNVDNLWLGIVGASGFDCSIFVDEVRRFSTDSGIHMERGRTFRCCDILLFTMPCFITGLTVTREYTRFLQNGCSDCCCKTTMAIFRSTNQEQTTWIIEEIST